jgi:hypothetical protein
MVFMAASRSKNSIPDGWTPLLKISAMPLQASAFEVKGMSNRTDF